VATRGMLLPSRIVTTVNGSPSNAPAKAAAALASAVASSATLRRPSERRPVGRPTKARVAGETARQLSAGAGGASGPAIRHSPVKGSQVLDHMPRHVVPRPSMSTHQPRAKHPGPFLTCALDTAVSADAGMAVVTVAASGREPVPPVDFVPEVVDEAGVEIDASELPGAHPHSATHSSTSTLTRARHCSLRRLHSSEQVARSLSKAACSAVVAGLGSVDGVAD